MVFHMRPKDVFVRMYTRFRFNKLENVRQHWRSHPQQLAFTFS